jgi:hypothetical protein
MPDPTTAATLGEGTARTNDTQEEASSSRSSASGFVDLEDLITGDVFRSLKRAARPVDFDGLGKGFRAEAEVHVLVRPRCGRKVGPTYSNYFEGRIRMLGNG